MVRLSLSFFANHLDAFARVIKEKWPIPKGIMHLLVEGHGVQNLTLNFALL